MQKVSITPHLWFDKETEEAAEFYVSVFPDSRVTNVTTIHDTPSGDCNIASFELGGQPFMAISAGPIFKFNEVISFIVNCDSQEEVEYFGGKFSAVPESEQCGWVKDKYGLSWQIVPTALGRLMTDPDPEKKARVTQTMFQMKKLDIAALERAAQGSSE